MSSDEQLESPTVVIDNGSDVCKAGFAGEAAPRSVFRSVVGWPRPGMADAVFGDHNDYYVADEALARIELLKFKHPVECGVVKNWDDMERIWHHMFYNELRVDPAEHSILVTEPPLNPRENREKTIQIMFETFSVPSFYLANQGVTALYGTGRTTGVVCDIGYGVTSVVPVFEGYSVPHAIMRPEVGGKEVTRYLRSLLNARGHSFLAFGGKEILRDIKEKFGYVALDFDEEMEKAATLRECDDVYTLPDGNIIAIGNERFRCAELLFKPEMNGLKLDGVDKTLFDCVRKCDIECWEEMYANIALSGRTTMLKGLPERFEKEIVKRAPRTMKVNVKAPPEREYAVWIGCSLLASLDTWPQMVIPHEEYNDAGPGIVHRKCF